MEETVYGGQYIVIPVKRIQDCLWSCSSHWAILQHLLIY